MPKLKNFDLHELTENRYLQGDSLTKKCLIGNLMRFVNKGKFVL